MKVQLLIATTNQENIDLIKKMNISTDAIIANQNGKFESEINRFNNKKIEFLSFNEKGVGLNRNNALIRSTGDICVVGDDDVYYSDDYEKIVMNSFEKFKDADVIIFNLHEPIIKRFVIKEKTKINHFNFMRFGAARIAFKTDKIKEKRITFSLLFGGGAKYNSGEDTLFLYDCLKNGLKVIAVPEYIGSLTEERESTWFKGYNEKFFFDKGVLYRSISKRWGLFLCLQYLLRRINLYKKEIGFFEAFKTMKKGMNSIR